MEERHSNGRRSTDSWGTKIGAGVAIVGMIYAVAAWGIPLATVPNRVTALEAHDTPLLYMTCVMFRDSHPQQVPKVCADAIQNGGGSNK